jgi:hypothetical protein
MKHLIWFFTILIFLISCSVKHGENKVNNIVEQDDEKIIIEEKIKVVNDIIGIYVYQEHTKRFQ